jgi:hypothetical protein
MVLFGGFVPGRRLIPQLLCDIAGIQSQSSRLSAVWLFVWVQLMRHESADVRVWTLPISFHSCDGFSPSLHLTHARTGLSNREQWLLTKHNSFLP